MEEQLFSTGDVARRLAVSSEFVRKLARAGKLPAVRTAGGQRIFRSDDVERLAAEREKQKSTTRERGKGIIDEKSRLPAVSKKVIT